MIDENIYKNAKLRKIYSKLTPLERIINFLMYYIPDTDFKEIQGTNGKYFIAQDGTVLSMCHYIPKILKPQITGSCYLYVFIGKNKRKIHQLVAETFIPNPEKKPFIHHKDGNRFNNNANNLIWVSQKEHSQIHAKLNQQKKKEKEQQNVADSGAD